MKNHIPLSPKKKGKILILIKIFINSNILKLKTGLEARHGLLTLNVITDLQTYYTLNLKV